LAQSNGCESTRGIDDLVVTVVEMFVVCSRKVLAWLGNKRVLTD
jgi:hypothetical protein